LQVIYFQDNTDNLSVILMMS